MGTPFKNRKEKKQESVECLTWQDLEPTGNKQSMWIPSNPSRERSGHIDSDAGPWATCVFPVSFFFDTLLSPPPPPHPRQVLFRQDAPLAQGPGIIQYVYYPGLPTTLGSPASWVLGLQAWAPSPASSTLLVLPWKWWIHLLCTCRQHEPHGHDRWSLMWPLKPATTCCGHSFHVYRTISEITGLRNY